MNNKLKRIEMCDFIQQELIDEQLECIRDILYKSNKFIPMIELQKYYTYVPLLFNKPVNYNRFSLINEMKQKLKYPDRKSVV